MSGQWLSVLTLALALILPLSALMQRNVSARKWLIMAGLWLLVFLAVAAIFRAAG